MPIQRTIRFARAVLITPALFAGCATHYTTPGSGVAMSALIDGDIQERFAREPAASFPARLALVHVQGPGYRSYRSEGYGSGRFSVVTTREVETDQDFTRIGNLPMVAAVATINRLLLPPQLESDKSLRLAAASLKCDLLFCYSFDTRYRIDETDLGPLEIITLGTLPNKTARVTSTASAALFDVRTGFVYGVVEATAREEEIASSWTSREAVDRARVRAERRSFEQLLDEFASMWKTVVEEHVRSAAR